jgi:DNA-binding NtrC family response regulator
MSTRPDGNGTTVLIVEDDTSLRDSCATVLRQDGYEVTTVGRGDDAVEMVQRTRFDIVLLDINIPRVTGTEVLQQTMAASPTTLVVMMTGSPNIESSVEAMGLGAWDYLPKPFTATHLQILLGRARHTIASNRRRSGETIEGSETSPEVNTGALIGRSPAFLRALELAGKVARTDASVFLTGESGSGKEVFANFIHRNSYRYQRPLVAVNCAALPETLLESEMFGHVKGAFTGAIRDRAGLLKSADGGTFFLDELTEMSLTIQAKLLRVIQDGIIRRVGSESVDGRVNVRFIAAMNRDPAEAVEQGKLRNDLYYRLAVVPIHVPPLRERVEDIPLMAEHFLRLYWARHRESGSPPPVFSEEALASLSRRSWNGNVRELQNVIEHAVVLLDPGQRIMPENLPRRDNEHHTGDGELRRVLAGFMNGEFHKTRERLIAGFETQYMSTLMERSGTNMSRAAKLAGFDRTTLYRLMEKHGFQRDTTIRAASESENASE